MEKKPWNIQPMQHQRRLPERCGRCQWSFYLPANQLLNPSVSYTPRLSVISLRAMRLILHPSFSTCSVSLFFFLNVLQLGRRQARRNFTRHSRCSVNTLNANVMISYISIHTPGCDRYSGKEGGEGGWASGRWSGLFYRVWLLLIWCVNRCAPNHIRYKTLTLEMSVGKSALTLSSRHTENSASVVINKHFPCWTIAILLTQHK